MRRSSGKSELFRADFLVFYQVVGEVLDVVRVLHERRDIEASLITH
jgi:toxin ParE1/3/4